MVKSTFRYILADIETNGLLDTVSVLHCLCIMDIMTGELRKYADLPGYLPLSDGLEIIKHAERIYGHNWLLYDAQVLKKLYGIPVELSKIRDTLILCQMLWPEIKKGDLLRVKRGEMPGRLIGRHNLEAWGYRLKEHKDNFGKETDWAVCTPEMVEYCAQDLKVNYALFKHISRKVRDGFVTPKAIELEHEVAELCFRMTQSGFVFNLEEAGSLYGELAAKSAEIAARLQLAFPPIEKCETFIPKVNNQTRGYIKGVPIIKRKLVKLNPKSREQLANRLHERYGWDAPRDPETGKPNLDDAVLSRLDFPEIPDIRDYLAIEKTLGQLASGKNAWLKLEKKGRIHTVYKTVGAVTARCTHVSPNIAQVPKVQKDKAGTILSGLAGGFGFECRSLFTVPPGWFLVGADMAGLELRCLGHYLSIFDDGEYIKVVLDGDVHTVNKEAAGLDTRDQAKTFIYAFLYGAGDEKIGSIVAPDASPEEQKRIGKQIKEKFLKGLPALEKLRKEIKKAAKEGYITALDGRKIPVRKAHAALNTLLQSAGALLCKQWMVLVDRELAERGLVWGRDFAFCAWVHDELQIAARTKEIAETVKAVCCDMATRAGEVMGFNCRLDGDAKIGRTWAETH